MFELILIAIYTFLTCHYVASICYRNKAMPVPKNDMGIVKARKNTVGLIVLELPHVSKSVLCLANCGTPHSSGVCDVSQLCWISARFVIGLSVLELPQVIKLLSRNPDTRFKLEYHVPF